MDGKEQVIKLKKDVAKVNNKVDNLACRVQVDPDELNDK